jgi:hypothetical protein
MKTKVIKLEAHSVKELIDMIDKIIQEATTKETPQGRDTVIVKAAIESIATKKGWKPERVDRWLADIAYLYPAAAFSIVARECAILLDKNYEDHIENSEKIFVISTLDGVIHEVCKKHIKNYRNFAAFRSISDARIVCIALRDHLKQMFGSGK